MSSVSDRAVLMPVQFEFREALIRQVNRALCRRSRAGLLRDSVEVLSWSLPLLSLAYGVLALRAGGSDDAQSFALGVASIAAVLAWSLCFAGREALGTAVDRADAHVQSVGRAFFAEIGRDRCSLVTHGADGIDEGDRDVGRRGSRR